MGKQDIDVADGGSKITSKQAVKEIVKILLLVHQDAKDNDGKPIELELSWICEESNNKHVKVPKSIVNEAKAWATEQLDQEEEEDDDEDAKLWRNKKYIIINFHK